MSESHEVMLGAEPPGLEWVMEVELEFLKPRPPFPPFPPRVPPLPPLPGDALLLIVAPPPPPPP